MHQSKSLGTEVTCFVYICEIPEMGLVGLFRKSVEQTGPSSVHKQFKVLHTEKIYMYMLCRYLSKLVQVWYQRLNSKRQGW